MEGENKQDYEQMKESGRSQNDSDTGLIHTEKLKSRPSYLASMGQKIDEIPVDALIQENKEDSRLIQSSNTGPPN